MVNSNNGHISYRLRDIFAYTLKIAIFVHCVLIVDPRLAEERPAI